MISRMVRRPAAGGGGCIASAGRVPALLQAGIAPAMRAVSTPAPNPIAVMPGWRRWLINGTFRKYPYTSVIPIESANPKPTPAVAATMPITRPYTR